MNNQSLPEKTKRFIAAINTKRVITVIVAIFAALVIFQLGVFVGFHKASFSRDWGDRYSRNFDPRARDSVGKFPRPDRFPTGHGAIGKIISVSENSLIIDGSEHIEKTVAFSDQTLVRKFKDTATTTDLIPDMFVVVIGEPNSDGVIDAKLIRVVPSPDELTYEEADDSRPAYTR